MNVKAARRLVRQVPGPGPAIAGVRRRTSPGSQACWQRRYAEGGTSGADRHRPASVADFLIYERTTP
jgi:hypothetical protein